MKEKGTQFFFVDESSPAFVESSSPALTHVYKTRLFHAVEYYYYYYYY